MLSAIWRIKIYLSPSALYHIWVLEWFTIVLHIVIVTISILIEYLTLAFFVMTEWAPPTKIESLYAASDGILQYFLNSCWASVCF